MRRGWKIPTCKQTSGTKEHPEKCSGLNFWNHARKLVPPFISNSKDQIALEVAAFQQWGLILYMTGAHMALSKGKG